MDQERLEQEKHTVRARVWDRLECSGVVPGGVSGSIPAFSGAERAAERLADLEVWGKARVVKAVPDRAQLPVRRMALSAGKVLYMAVPRLATREPFRMLDPATLSVAPDQAASHQDAMRVGVPVTVDQMPPIDLVVTGSVAVTPDGARLGKGAGYGDLEIALLLDAGLVGTHTVIVTTVHDQQVLDEVLPESEHDCRVDLIVTPTRGITCAHPHRPRGLDWERLTPAQLSAIPVLAELWSSRLRERSG